MTKKHQKDAAQQPAGAASEQEQEQPQPHPFAELNREDFAALAKSPRRRAREAALLTLFQLDQGQNPPEMVEYTLAMLDLSEENRAFVRGLLQGVQAEQEALDQLLADYAAAWQPQRFAAVDRSILRLALYELLHPQQVPANIIINEAIELAKKFSTPESGAFVNGLLDTIYRERIQQREPV